MKYDFDNVKDQLNGWNKNFWENLTVILARILRGEGTVEEKAVISTAFMVECFRGWSFQLPTTKECYEWAERNDTPTLTIQAWAPENNGEIIVVDLTRPEDYEGTAFHRLVRELVVEED